MSVHVVELDGNAVLVEVSGILGEKDFAASESALAEIIERRGAVRLLVRAEGFLGWARGGSWGDVSFQARYDDRIEKIAIVAPKRWEDLALAFSGKGLRPVAIEYFPNEELERAKAWLSA